MIKRMNLCFTLMLVFLFAHNTQVEAFAISEIFSWPLSISEKMFNWNPFKTGQTRINDFQDDSPLFEWKPNPLNKSKTLDNEKRYYTYGCECRNYSCSCCGHIEVAKINLNETGCLNFIYSPENYTMELNFKLNDWVVYNNTISITNPPPLCFDMSHLAESASICLKFYNLDARNYTLSGCVDVIAKLYHKEIARVKIGCFRMANHSTMISKSIMSINSGNNQNYYVYSSNISQSNNQDIVPKFNLSSVMDVFSKIPKFNIINKIEIPQIQTDKLLNSFYENFFKMGRALGHHVKKFKTTTTSTTTTTTTTTNEGTISNTTNLSGN